MDFPIEHARRFCQIVREHPEMFDPSVSAALDRLLWSYPVIPLPQSVWMAEYDDWSNQ